MNGFCEMCGEPIVDMTSRQRFCKECARVRFLEKKKEWYRQDKLRREQQGEPPRKQSRKKPISTLAQAVQEANAAGMSYGQYMAKKANSESHFADHVRMMVRELEEFQ